jgi:hypothetical protein
VLQINNLKQLDCFGFRQQKQTLIFAKEKERQEEKVVGGQRIYP